MIKSSRIELFFRFQKRRKIPKTIGLDFPIFFLQSGCYYKSHVADSFWEAVCLLLDVIKTDESPGRFA